MKAEPAVPAPSAVKDAAKAMEKFVVNVSMSVAGPPPVWVVKNIESGMYMRVPSSAGVLWVRSLRLATRLDSRLWAETLVQTLRHPLTGKHAGKAVRIWTKSEREAHKARAASASSFVWMKEKRDEPTIPNAAPPEPAK